MFLSILQKHLPSSWSNLSDSCGYRKEEILKGTQLYRKLSEPLQGDFNEGVSSIIRVEAPFLYGHFLLKQAEYKTRGNFEIRELYHCTAAHNIDSILRTNLDWRLANRVKFGKGVSFSPCPTYANQQATRDNGKYRAMIVADVLIGKIQKVNYSTSLPINGSDTTMGNNGNVYVKFYDNEFYPKYVIYYKSKGFHRNGIWHN